MTTCLRLETEFHEGCRKVLCKGCDRTDCPEWKTPPIKVVYESVDGCRKTKSFSKIEKARKWATDWIGESCELGGSYAVSDDGIGKITVRGTTLRKLFGRDE